MEWIDYRREASFWPFFFVPPLLSVAWAYGGWIGLALVAAFATVVTACALLGAAFLMVGWVVGNAVLDVAVPAFQAMGKETHSGLGRSATVR